MTITFVLTFDVQAGGGMSKVELWAEQHPGGGYLFATADESTTLREALNWANEEIAAVLGQAPQRWEPRYGSEPDWEAELEVAAPQVLR